MIYLDTTGNARTERRKEMRDPNDRLSRLYQAWRLIQADAKHPCTEVKDANDLCSQDRIVIKVALDLMRSWEKTPI